MQRFSSFDGTTIAYQEVGSEPGRRAVLLQHGFASTGEINWVRPGLVDALAAAGRRVVYLDARGHGASDHPHDPAAYADMAMAHDVRCLADHLGLEAFEMAGYSMGSFVAMAVAASDARLGALFLGGAGLGQARVRRPEVANAIAEALEADDPSSVSDPTGRAFRNFAEATKQDRLALAAIQRSPRQLEIDLAALVKVPALVVSGEKDTLVGDPAALAARLPFGRSALVPGDHMSAVTKPEFRQALLEWAVGR